MSSSSHLSTENCIEGPLHIVLRIPRAEVVPAAHAAWVLRGALVLLAVLPLLEIDVFFKSLLEQNTPGVQIYQRAFFRW